MSTPEIVKKGSGSGSNGAHGSSTSNALPETFYNAWDTLSTRPQEDSQNSAWDTRVQECIQLITQNKKDGKIPELRPKNSGDAHQALLMNEAYFQLKEYRSCLTVLTRLVLKRTNAVETQTCAHDLFDPVSLYSEWGTQWCRVKSECTESGVKALTMADCVKGERVSKNLLARALRLEINTYLCSRGVFVEALISAGEKLENYAKTLTDTAIGLLTQAIGFWWGGSTHETFCVQACQAVLGVLHDAAIKEVENPLISIMVGIAMGWLGLTHLRTLETRANNDFDVFLAKDKLKNPSKYKKIDEQPGTRGIALLTSVNIKDESEVATNIIFCIDALFTKVQFEDKVVKAWVDQVCPGLIMTTARLCALRISAYGDSYNTIRAWHVVNVLARIYNRKYAQFQAGMEIYRAVPLLNEEAVNVLEQLYEDGKKLKHVHPVYLARFSLTRAIVDFKNKKYQTGLDSLREVLELRLENIHTSAYFMLMAEAYLLLADYRMLAEDRRPDFKLIDSSLKSITSTGLAYQGLRMLGNLSREGPPSESGWVDLFHNGHLVSVQLSCIPRGIQLLNEGGRVTEARFHASDAIYMCQKACLVTRCIEILMLVAELEIPCQKFDWCLRKLDGMDKLLSVEVQGDQGIENLTLDQLRVHLEKLEIEVPDPQKLLRCSLQQWRVIPVDLPGHRYPDTGRHEAFKKGGELRDRKYGLPKLFNHPLTCACYTCLNPILIPVTLRFLLLQAKLTAALAKVDQKPIRLISVTRLQHQRAMLRLLNSKDIMILELYQGLGSVTAAENAWESIYLPFFYQSSVNSLHTLMTVTPACNLSDIMRFYNQLKEGTTLVPDPDPQQTLKSMEIVASAVMESTFLTGDIPIRNSDLRDRFRDGLMGSDKQPPNKMEPDPLSGPFTPTAN